MAAWAAVLVACKGSGAGGDWSGVALDDTVESSVNGVKFALRLPKGWKRDVDQPSLKGWRPDRKDYTVEPSVTVGELKQPPQSVDEYIESMQLPGSPVIDKKVRTAESLVVVSHTGDTVRVDYVVHRDATYLGCSAFQMTAPNPRATKEWLERLCGSLVIE